MQTKRRTVHRGELYYMDFGCKIGSQQSGIRPVLIVQNDKGNYYSNTVIVAPITSKIKKLYMPTHVLLYPGCTGLKKASMVLLEQITTVDKAQLMDFLGRITEKDLMKINQAICISMGTCLQKW